MSTRENLPYWVQQKEGHSGAAFAHGFYLGFEANKWPIQAFALDADGRSTAAEYWVTQHRDDVRRVLIGPLTIDDDAPVLEGRVIPSRVELGEISSGP